MKLTIYTQGSFTLEVDVDPTDPSGSMSYSNVWTDATHEERYPEGQDDGPITSEGEATDSNVHELPSAYRLHITSPDDSSEYPQEGRVCSHFPEHDLLDTRCEDRYPKEGH